MTDEEYAEAVGPPEIEAGPDREDANNSAQGNWFEYGNGARQTALRRARAGRIPAMTRKGLRPEGHEEQMERPVFEGLQT